MGGPLDRDAGDGTKVKSAIPIETKSPAVRKGLAQFWQDSRWAIEKDIWVRKGAALGDIVLKGCDDLERRRVVMEVLHPGTLTWIDRDRHTGQVFGYTREEKRYDPRKKPARTPSVAANDTLRHQDLVDYREDAWIEKGRVVYETRLDNILYDWRLDPRGNAYGAEGAEGSEPRWTVPYPFIPMVVTQHMPVGLDWGLAEGHPVLEKVFELADSGSNLGDYVRRILNDAAIVTGTSAGELDIDASPNTPTVGNPQPGRTKRKLLGTTEPDAKVLFLTQDLDLPGLSGHVKALKDDVNEDFPELDVDLWKTGDPSGRAMRLARQRAEMKVQQRRTGYDKDLEALQRMCLAIGGIRGYEDYRGLATDDPFNDKVVAHSIAHRPVFAPDPIDDIEERTALYGMMKMGLDAGLPTEWVMKQWGFSKADIDEVKRLKEQDEAAALDRVKQRMAMAGDATEPTDNGDPNDPTDSGAPLDA
jgi:hypothetical protein